MTLSRDSKKKQSPASDIRVNHSLDRWDNHIVNSDHRSIWRAISWKGDIDKTYRYTPLLDEVYETMKQVKSNKSCGTDGLSPGILCLLHASWITFLYMSFNF